MASSIITLVKETQIPQYSVRLEGAVDGLVLFSGQDAELLANQYVTYMEATLLFSLRG